MKYSEAKLGRIFILRLEHGDKIPDIIEEFAAGNKSNLELFIFLVVLIQTVK